MAEIITQSHLPIHPWAKPQTSRLPGVNPLDWQDWVLVDDAFAAQMHLRESLMTNQRDAVFQADPNALAASEELLQMLVGVLAGVEGYTVSNNDVTRPDGVKVPLNADHPLIVAGRLVQQDWCLLKKVGAEHILSAAILCFPANWRLAEKFGRPMSEIHEPVEVYTDDVAKRVQRIFDRIQVDRPVWRANYLLYADADLHQPKRYQSADIATGKWVRVERQSLVRLPKSDYLCFGIHTFVVPLSSFTPSEKAAFLHAWENHYS